MANYSLAMTQLQSILERFAAQDLRSFLFQKSLSGVRLLSFSLIPIVLLSSTRVFTRTDTHTSALPRLTIRILTEYYCTYCT